MEPKKIFALLLTAIFLLSAGCTGERGNKAAVNSPGDGKKTGVTELSPTPAIASVPGKKASPIPLLSSPPASLPDSKNNDPSVSPDRLPVPRGITNVVIYDKKLENLPPEKLFLTDKEIMETVDLKEGEAIADIGCGAGIYTFPFADITGKKGVVYAVDLDPNSTVFINKMKRKMKEKYGKDYRNIKTLQNDIDDVKLPENSIDIAFLKDVHNYTIISGYLKGAAPEQNRKTLEKFEMNNRLFTQSIFKALKPGGRLIIVEMKKDYNKVTNFGKEDVIRMVEKAAPFVKNEEIEPITDISYLLIFGKKQK